MFDLHTHHVRCGHAEGSLRDYIEAAIERGLTTIGLSDHTPFWGVNEDHPKPWVAMACSEFPRYVREAVAMRDEYAGVIQVLVAAEADVQETSLSITARELARFELDYVIGSVHVLDGIDIYRPEFWARYADASSQREIAAQYFRLVGAAARSGYFQVIGHIDALKSACPDIARLRLPEQDEMLQAIAASGALMEINTSGKTKACGGWYPSPELLERAFEFGVRITFGSDAHVPTRVGDDFDSVARRALEVGYEEWFTVVAGRLNPHPISPGHHRPKAGVTTA